PKAGRAGTHAHHELMAALAPPRGEWFKAERTAQQIASEIEEEFASSGCSHMIISSEEFCYLADLSVITTHFKKRQLKFVAYIRRQEDWLLSRIKHEIQSAVHQKVDW